MAWYSIQYCMILFLLTCHKLFFRLDQELDFLVSQQNELDDLLKPLEESVKQHSTEYGQEPDREREKMYATCIHVCACVYGRCAGQWRS